MRIAIVGQQPFGKAVLEAFVHRGDTVAGVFCAPEKSGAPPDALKMAAEQRGLPVFQLASLRTEEARERLRALAVDLGVMAYVLQFAPEDFTAIPRYGTIQYHPSLLPRHRGPSSINWPIILGETSTGLTIFRPTEGLDEGPIVLQKSTPIGPDETLGKVYFERLFPLGVAALMEAADLVMASGSPTGGSPQDPSLATYEGWCRLAECCVNWHSHSEQIYNLIRGCDPAPGAWTTFKGKKIQFFDAGFEAVGRHSQVSGIGTVVSIGERGIGIAAQGGRIHVRKVRYDHGEKLSAQQFSEQHGVVVGGAINQ